MLSNGTTNKPVSGLYTTESTDCTNNNMSALSTMLSTKMDLYSECVAPVISGKYVISIGFVSFFMESYLYRMCVLDLQHDIAKLYRSQIIDKLSAHCRDVDETELNDLLSIIEQTSDEDFRSAFKSLIPQRKAWRNFVLRCYSTYWGKQVRQSVDAALLNGIEVENDLLVFSLSLDGTFALATGLTIEQQSFDGVALTSINQKGDPVNLCKFVPQENGDSFVKTIVEMYKTILNFRS